LKITITTVTCQECKLPRGTTTTFVAVYKFLGKN